MRARAFVRQGLRIHHLPAIQRSTCAWIWTHSAPASAPTGPTMGSLPLSISVLRMLLYNRCLLSLTIHYRIRMRSIRWRFEIGHALS